MLKSIYIAIVVLLNLSTNTCSMQKEEVVTKISLDKTEYSAEEDILMTFEVLNNTPEDLNVCNIQTPFEGFLGKYLIIKNINTGEELQYAGPMVKRGAPSDLDYQKIDPNTCATCTVNLRDAYTFKDKGVYTVQYIGKTMNNLPDAEPVVLEIK